MAILYIALPSKEAVTKELWRWVAIYKDGTALQQFDLVAGVGGVFRKFSEIDQSQIAQLKLVHDTLSEIIINVPAGAKLVHGYTVKRSQHLTTTGEFMYEETYKGYKFGYILDGHTHGLFIDHDNSVQIIHDFNNIVMKDKV